LASLISSQSILEAASESQERDLLDLRRIFDLSVDLMCIADADGRFRMVSASVAKILGYTPTELIGRSSLDFVHPDDLQRTLSVHESLVGGATVVEFENRYLRKDGATVDLSWSTSWSADVGLSYAVARDITSRKRADALRDSERDVLQMSLVRLELARSIARLGYWERDLLSDRMYAYGETNAILGIPEDQSIDIAAFLNRVVEEDRHTVIAGYSEANRGNATGALQFRLRRPDGSLRYIYAQRRTISDASGKAIRVIGTLQDVTERYEADLERQRYLAQLAFLADATRKVNSLLTIEELLRVITDIARDLVGAHVAIGHVTMDSSQLHSTSHSDKYSKLDTAAISHVAESPGALTVGLVTGSGSKIGWIRAADRREGKFTKNDERVLLQLADLASVGLENAVLYAELEARVRKRTQELEQSNRELEAFSYSVSHDLRGPLRAIAGFTGLLRERHYETIDADSRRYIDRVLAGTQRMSSLIDDLLELGRVTRVEIKREPVDLSALAQVIVAHLRERAPERVAAITIEPDRKVHGDLRLMEIVLENLFDNAWKFTAGRPLTEVRFGATTDDRGEGVFFIEDNGVGFDPRYSANLFGVFQRLHSTSEFPGTGVGLATVQRIVQRHGGRVWAQAGTDRGATFYFTIAKG
jgi:PAS domain S-box-containing protein